MDAMRALVEIIAASQLSITIQCISWLIPLVQSIHILAIAALMANVVMLDVRVAGLVGTNDGFGQLLDRHMPWMWRAVPILATSGIILIIGEPERELLSYVFWIKMGLLLLVLALAAMIAHSRAPQALPQLPHETRSRLRLLALVSLLAWVGIITCGRMIAYA